LRVEFSQQLENFQPAGKAEDSWKVVDENMKFELKEIKLKMEKQDMSEMILNLRNEVADLKKKIEVKEKLSSQYSTPVKKLDGHNNKGRWIKGERDYHSPVHSPEMDWWKRKRKWYRPLWCDAHEWGTHTTSMCWKKKKIWKIKEVKVSDTVVTQKSQ